MSKLVCRRPAPALGGGPDATFDPPARNRRRKELTTKDLASGPFPPLKSGGLIEALVVQDGVASVFAFPPLKSGGLIEAAFRPKGTTTRICFRR